MLRCGAALLCAAALAAGCGGDDEEPRGDTGAQPAPESTTPDTSTGSAPSDEDRLEGGDGGGAEPTPDESPEGGARTSPEDEPGGAGDEIPARSQALITGRDGRLSPRRVFVPPFISVRVELRSADGAQYTLRGGGQALTAGGRVETVTADFDGLRPGRRLVLGGASGTVTVEASAEPGP